MQSVYSQFKMNDNGNAQDLRHLIQFDKLKRYYNLCEKKRKKAKKTLDRMEFGEF